MVTLNKDSVSLAGSPAETIFIIEVLELQVGRRGRLFESFWPDNI